MYRLYAQHPVFPSSQLQCLKSCIHFSPMRIQTYTYFLSLAMKLQ